MKLENQVVSLELAKKLKELGVNQESLCWWLRSPGEDWRCEPIHVTNIENISAFTVAELGEMLREKFFAKWASGWDEVHEEGTWYGELRIGVSKGGKNLIREWFFGNKTEADARAKMLVYLIENNLLTPSLKN